MLGLVALAMNPQVHAFDNASLVETLATQATVVLCARRLAQGKPVIVSPITLKMRFNPNATGPIPPPLAGELPPQVDPRQMSLLGAGWTMGSIKYLAAAGAQAVTYYETTGWRGVMETEAGMPLPDKFRSLPGGVYPLYHVLADVGEYAGGAVLPSTSSDPLRVEGLALQQGNRVRVILANMTAEPQEVTLPDPGAPFRARVLDETNAEEAMGAAEEWRAQPGGVLSPAEGQVRLALRPYAVARLDGPQ
jgi:D-apionolactonase